MSIHSFLQTLQQRASQRNVRVALADASDPRTLKAASMLVHQSIARPVLIGDESEITALARSENVSLHGIECLNATNVKDYAQLADAYYHKRRHKGLGTEQAYTDLKAPLLLAGMLLERGDVDCCVAGPLSSTADVLRAGLTTIGLAENMKTLSSYFLMLVGDRVLAFADCAVVPYPDVVQLADIADATARNFQMVTETDALVAFLSFSSKGSAAHESVQKVREAYELFHARCPLIKSDGELQVDAAIIESVAAQKAPNSPLRGQANVLIFPNLDAANIGYKLTERLASAVALGPIVQGLSKPYCDLSRGCSVQDIVYTSCIAALMCNQQN